jgi:hypothetical protein
MAGFYIKKEVGMKKTRYLSSILLVCLLAASLVLPTKAAASQPRQLTTIYLPAVMRYATRFSFNPWLYGAPSTLYVWVQDIDTNTGWVEINGVDTGELTSPFTWDWGDGAVEAGWFPMQHTYASLNRNYIVRVTALYNSGGSDTKGALVRFVSPAVTPLPLPPDLAVTIPDHMLTLGTRMYPPPTNLTYFDDSFFPLTSRATVEYILSAVAYIQDDLSNSDEYLIDGAFQQVVLRDPSFGGMYSLWFTNPPAFASSNAGFSDSIGYSSFFHEMGHNFSLNSPADFYYGGRIDGNANAIFSETIANIYAHTSAYILLNNPGYFGIDPSLEFEIEHSAASSILVTRSAYDRYLSSGMQFHSWNDPATSEDETFDTFMTLAYKFCTHAEQAGQGYRQPAKRMMALLEKFDASLLAQYDPQNDTPAADAFRATLLVTAMSYAFSTDLRSEFRSLNFPISNSVYDQLMGMMAAY